MKAKRVILFGLLVSLILAIFISPFASSWPDGLEKVAEKYGFLEKGEGHEVFHAPIPDYAMPGIKVEPVATALAGLVGTLIVFVIAYGVGIVIKRKAEPK